MPAGMRRHCPTLSATLTLRDFELDVLGFATEDLDRYLAGIDGNTTSETDEGELPEVPVEPVSKPGDLWILGDHRVLCGDTTVLSDVERLMDGQLADMVFGIRLTTWTTATAPRTSCGGKTAASSMMPSARGSPSSSTAACVNLLMVTKGACYVCMSSSELHTLQRAFIEAGGKWSTFVIWAKNTFTLGRSDYQRQYEPILYGWKAGRRALLVRRP